MCVEGEEVARRYSECVRAFGSLGYFLENYVYIGDEVGKEFVLFRLSSSQRGVLRELRD